MSLEYIRPLGWGRRTGGEMAMGSGKTVGRAAELQHLERLLHEARRGRAQFVLIEGEAGIGKTSLVEEVSARAARAGFRTLSASADEIDQRRSFAALGDCVWALPRAREAIARPGGRRCDSATVALVEDLTAAAPLVLAVEDLQWADPASLIVLHRLAKQVTKVRMLLVGTCRPVPRPPLLEALLTSWTARGLSRFALGPLSDDEVSSLAGQLLEARPGDRLRGQLSRAGGNPLFVKELVSALERDGVVQRGPDGVAEVGSVGLPVPLALTVLQRLSSLSPPTRRALQVASVLGRRFSVADLSGLIGVRVAAMLAPLEEAIRAGVLGEEGPHLVFRHAVVRDAVYEDLPSAVRRALHVDAARALAAAGGAVDRVAEHFARGARPGDTEAVAWVRRAALEAIERSPVVAVDLFDRALELCSPSRPSAALVAERANALLCAGRLREAESVCRAGLQECRHGDQAWSLRLSLTRALIAMGRLHDAIAQADTVTAAREPHPECTQLVAWAAYAHMLAGDVTGTVAWAERACRLAGSFGDDVTRSVIVSARSGLACLRGNPEEALELGTLAGTLAASTSMPKDAQVDVNLSRAVALLTLDRVDEALTVIDDCRSSIAPPGGSSNVLIHSLAALAHFHRGKWDEALAACAVARQLVEVTGSAHDMLSLSIEGLIALYRDELDCADRALAQAERRFLDSGPQYGLIWMMLGRALLKESKGHVAAAEADLAEAWALCSGAGWACTYSILGPDVVRLARQHSGFGAAKETARALAEVAARAPIPSVVGAALRCRGLLEQDPGMLVQAVEVYRGSRRPLDRALACEDAAKTLLEVGRRAEAVGLLEEAVKVYEALAAMRASARVEATLRAAGRRRGSRVPRKRSDFGWEALTDSELRVVRLVAEGLSNPEIAERLFVSRPTVKTHVSHALAKLALPSRVLLAAEVARRNPGRGAETE